MTATPDAAGRPCPYCRSALGEGEQVTECPACKATHHADCWAENGGCAVPLCEGGPKEGATPVEAAAPPAEVEAPTEVVPVDPPPPTAPTPPPPLPTVAAPTAAPPPRRPVAGKAAPPPGGGAPHPAGIGFLPVLVGVIILLGGGTAAAIILAQKHSSNNSPTTAEAASASSVEENSEPFESEASAETEPVYQPTPPERVEQALQAHFSRLVADNYAAAYADLTPAEGEAIGGEEAWIAAQSEDQLKHFELTVNVSMHGPHAATAEILSFATHAYATGCHTWTGSWEMAKQYGRWLIAAADLERGSC